MQTRSHAKAQCLDAAADDAQFEGALDALPAEVLTVIVEQLPYDAVKPYSFGNFSGTCKAVQTAVADALAKLRENTTP